MALSEHELVEENSTLPMLSFDTTVWNAVLCYGDCSTDSCYMLASFIVPENTNSLCFRAVTCAWNAPPFIFCEAGSFSLFTSKFTSYLLLLLKVLLFFSLLCSFVSFRALITICYHLVYLSVYLFIMFPQLEIKPYEDRALRSFVHNDRSCISPSACHNIYIYGMNEWVNKWFKTLILGKAKILLKVSSLVILFLFLFFYLLTF